MSGHAESDTHRGGAADALTSGNASVDGHHFRGSHDAPAVADALLLIAADVLDDLEDVRKRTDNRLRSLTTEPVEGERGGWFGKGIPADAPEVQRVQAIADAIGRLEHQAELDLQRVVRKHPLGPWIKQTIGLGEKQAGRLLAAIGDPTTRRTVSQLWAYCGYHVLHPGHSTSDAQSSGAGVDPSSDTGQRENGDQSVFAGVAPTRQRGQKANWSTTAKSRAWLCATSCIKQAESPYRKVYDDAREKYAYAVHARECKRCGPSGKPAQPGSPLSAGHQHARALRIVAKAILRDIWIEARRAKRVPEPIHGPFGGLDSASDSHCMSGIQGSSAVAGNPSAGGGHSIDGLHPLSAAAGSSDEETAA